MNFATPLGEILQDQWLFLLFVTSVQEVMTVQVCPDDGTPLVSVALMDG